MLWSPFRGTLLDWWKSRRSHGLHWAGHLSEKYITVLYKHQISSWLVHQISNRLRRQAIKCRLEVSMECWSRYQAGIHHVHAESIFIGTYILAWIGHIFTMRSWMYKLEVGVKSSLSFKYGTILARCTPYVIYRL